MDRPSDTAGRMHHDGMAELGAFGIERLLHDQRAIRTCRKNRAAPVFLEMQR
jgi:hypothetical protein